MPFRKLKTKDDFSYYRQRTFVTNLIIIIIYLVVGSNVLLDGSQRGSLRFLQSLDSSHNHNSAGRMFSLLCGLLGLDDLRGSGFNHFE